MSFSLKFYTIWSEYGKKYRQNNINSFNINDFEYLVALRRRFDITEGKLENYYDLFNVDSEASINQITDPFLIKILEEKKGESRVTNIIRSIQLNQNDIIEHDFNSNIIVQGCAGSGKTMILLHRLANIKYNNPNRDMSKIKIITPNIHFKLFIDELSKNLGIDQIEKVTLNEFYITILMKYRERNRKQKKDYGILSMELTGTSAAQYNAPKKWDMQNRAKPNIME